MGEWVDGGQKRGGPVDGAMIVRTGHRLADGARIRVYWRMGRRGGGARDLKGTHTSLSISLSCARTTCFIAERVCKVLGSVMRSILGLGICFSKNKILAVLL